MSPLPPSRKAVMHGLKGERVLMRIHVEEQDRYHGRPAYEVIVELLRRRHFAGATVLRGAMGFGATGRIHKERVLAVKEDVPIVIEVVDREEKIQSILPEIDQMVGGGLITLEKVRVIMYRPDATPEDREEDHRIDITGGWRAVPSP
jgi:PII-like signaling protein